MEKIGDGVYHLPDIIGGPTILLGETVVLVDTGVPGSDDAILAAVEEIGRNATDVTDIVITHADGDHVGSLSALVARTGATVWAGEHEADVIEGKAPARGGDTTKPRQSTVASCPERRFHRRVASRRLTRTATLRPHLSLPAGRADSDRRRRDQQRRGPGGIAGAVHRECRGCTHGGVDPRRVRPQLDHLRARPIDRGQCCRSARGTGSQPPVSCPATRPHPHAAAEGGGGWRARD